MLPGEYCARAVDFLSLLGKAAKEARDERGVKPSRIAGIADYDQTVITRFEKGEAWPRNPDRIINAYAEVLEIEPLDIWRDAVERGES